MSYLINLNAAEEVQLSTLQQFLHGSKTSAMRWALAQTVEKILPSMLLSNNATMQPPPSPAAAVPSAPAARTVPTVEELVADYRAKGCMMPTYWRHLTEEERDRVARECNLSEGDLEFLEGTLEETR